MKQIDSINFNGKRALIRVDFNVPLNAEQQITDDKRIQAALPTIQKVLNDGGSVVLMSHMGRPKGENVPEMSLKHIVSHVGELLKTDVKFVDSCISDEAFECSSNLKSGEVLLLENLRFNSEEKKGDSHFAETLAKHGEVYINDAFGAAHRAHSSTSVIANFFPKDAKMFGYLMASEVENAQKLLQGAEKPFVAITGGAKVSDKIAILENLIGKADDIIIGGGMAYTFMKAQGGAIGNSLCEDDRLELARELLERAEKAGTKLHLPQDSVIADAFAADANTNEVDSKEIQDGWMGLDIGAKAVKEFSDVVLNAKSILWNGPMGVFEMDKFANGTKSVAGAVASATANGAYSLIGGGDSAAAVKQFGYVEQVSHVSTGGGALLEMFEGKELPGIQAINSDCE